MTNLPRVGVLAGPARTVANADWTLAHFRMMACSISRNYTVLRGSAMLILRRSRKKAFPTLPTFLWTVDFSAMSEAYCVRNSPGTNNSALREWLCFRSSCIGTLNNRDLYQLK